MGVQHYISKAHFSNLIMYHWHVLLLLYIQISGYHAITPSPGTTIGTPLTAYSNTTRLCVVSVVQSCPCNATGMYCASVNPPLREVPTVEVKTIVHLDLTGNALERIERGSFLGLEFLISLYLGHNLIDFIDPHAFNNLYKLEILNLEDNQLVNLDPSGRTFQHLTSLKFLYLQKNLITKVNKYTFLTMAAYSPTPATVNLENNPIECDCNVWALKQWRQDNNASGKMNRVTISLMCNNLSYLEVPESIFGSCNASNDGIFSGETRCPICVNESTNDRCHNPATSVCITDLNPNIVCHKTVAWNASTQSIALSSKCLSYDNCMQEEANNADTCSLVNLANTSVACAFCCRGPTCAKNSIGGRTRDFTFYLSFYFNAANSETINLINNTISSRQIESAFLGIPGGIAVNLYAINPKSNQTYRIVLQLHVTTLNTVTEKSLSSTLRSQVDSMTRLIHIYYPDRVTLTTSLEGIECNITTDVCPLNMICTESRDGQTRCLCDSSSFYNRNVKTCSPLAQLQVKNISASATADKVFLNWTTNTYGSNVTYTVQVTPDNEWITTSSTTACGAVLSGLDPGTEYNFTITSNLTSRFFEKLTETSLAGVWTNAVHGNSCNVSVPREGITCTGPHIRCIQRFEGLAYCLCSPGYYFNMDKTCRDVNELQVKNLNATSITNDTVTLSWMANKHGSDVVYRIEPQPHTGQEVPNSVGIHGGMWTGLYPGMQYNFSVTSVLPANNFYENITVASQVLNIWTKVLINVTIDISYVKQDAEFQPFMSNSSSPEYLMEARRITTGVTAVFDKVMDVVYVQLLQFRPVSINQYEVDLVVTLTTYDAETLGQVLSEIIQNNTQNTEGFFYNERLNSLDLSVNNTGIINSNQCPYSVTSLDKGGIKWNAADVGRQYTPCPYNNLLDHPKAMAERICLIGENKLPVWGAVNASLCITKEAAMNPNISEVFKRNITKDNAQTASVYLRMITNSTDNLTAEMMDQSVTVLEKLTTEDVLQEPNVATNVIECVNNLINVNIKTLQQSEKETRVSSRLLDVIDSVANKAPLTEGKLMISTPNLAVAAQKIDSTETRDITLVTEANGNEESNVNIDVLLGDNSQLKNTTSLTVPVPAVIDSLTTEQKQKLNRISFTVHRSDIIFSVIRSSVNGGKLDEDDDNRDGYNNNNESRKNESFITKINSLVVSASVPEIKIQNLSRNVTMDFEHTNNSATNARCVFWDEKLSHGTGAWSDDGCGVVKSDSESTTCGCNHLTNFALLMDVYNQGSKLSALDRKILSIISYVGCGISCFALLITLITYSAFKKLRRDNPAKILINLCLALLCSNLVYLLGMQEYSFGNTVSCKVVAVLLHYFLLASLTWMAVEAFYMYLALVIVFKTYYTNFILKCSLVGWGAPLLVIIITLAVNTTDNYGFINSGMCWLKNPAFYAAFVGPVCFILLVNCIAFILVVKQLASMSSVRLHKAERNSTIQRLRGAVGVVILLGLTWIFAIFAIGQASVAFYYLFAVFNSLQGLFIFIFYCLLKNDAVVALKRSLPCFEEYGDSTKSYSHSKGATNTAAGHHLIDHKTGSSKKKDSSKGTLSTTVDSRKDSCFSTLSGSNIVDDKDVDGVTSNTNTISNEKATSRLLHTSHDVSEDTSSNMSTNSDKPMKYSIPEFREREDITIAEPPTGIQDTSFCQHSSEADGGSFYNIPLSPTDASLPKLTPPSLSLSQTSDQNSLQMKSPENSPVCLKHADETPNPSIRADGEIDYSHLASVSDILNKLESNTQHSVTDIDNNVITKPEQPTQETEDDTSSYMITNCDTPTGYFESVMHDPDVRDTSLHASVESQEARLYENQPVTSNDYTSDIPTTHTDDPLPIPSCLHRFQTSNPSSLQMESPENSVSCSLDPTDQTNEEKLNPSFTPFRADGEIDYSHLASVSDIQHKFEWSMSESSDKNVTKI